MHRAPQGSACTSRGRAGKQLKDWRLRALTPCAQPGRAPAGRGSLAPKLSVLLTLRNGDGLRSRKGPPQLLQVPKIHAKL